MIPVVPGGSGTVAAMYAPSRFEEATEQAHRRALLVGIVAAVLVAVLVAVIGLPLVGLLVLVVGIAGWVLFVRSGFERAHEHVVGPLGTPVSAGDRESFRNALEGVAILTGVRAPRLRLIDTTSANAMVAADRDAATVVVTAGLLEGGRTVEYEVLAAELLCRVRDGSARFGTVAAGLPAALRWAGGLSAARVAETLGDQRASRGDVDAVAITRYPPGLIAAFEAMTGRGTDVSAAAATAPLWIAPAVGTSHGVDPAVDRTANQPLDYRIAVLREL